MAQHAYPYIVFSAVWYDIQSQLCVVHVHLMKNQDDARTLAEER